MFDVNQITDQHMLSQLQDPQNEIRLAQHDFINCRNCKANEAIVGVGQEQGVPVLCDFHRSIRLQEQSQGIFFENYYN